MKILTVRQPWASLIVLGYKDIENRTWTTCYRGNLLIQASKAELPRTERRAALDFAAERDAILPETLSYGGIIGMVSLLDCVEAHSSPWFHGPVGWILTNPRELPFIPCRGQLGLFRPQAELLYRIESLLCPAAVR